MVGYLGHIEILNVIVLNVGLQKIRQMGNEEFEVGEQMLKDICPVCKKKLKLGEKIVLVPIQAVREGFGNVMCLPTHTKCYWVEKD